MLDWAEEASRSSSACCRLITSLCAATDCCSSATLAFSSATVGGTGCIDVASWSTTTLLQRQYCVKQRAAPGRAAAGRALT